MPGNNDPNSMLAKFGIESDRAKTKTSIKDSDAFRESVDNSQDSVEGLNSSLLEFDQIASDTFDNAANKAKELEDAARSAADEQARINQEQAGEKARAEGAVSTLTRGAGRLALGSQFGQVTQITELGGAIKELSGSGKEGTTVIKGLADATGLSNFQLGAAGIAMTALAVATMLAVSAIAKQTDEVRQRATVAEELARVQIQGDQAVLARIEAGKEEIVVQQEIIKVNRNTNNSLLEDAIEYSGLLGRIFVDTSEDVANDLEKDAKSIIASEQKIIDGLLELGVTAEQSADDVAMAARRQVEVTQQASTLSSQAAQDRLAEIENQKAAIQAEIDARRASGDGTEDNIDKIQELEAQINSLGQESSIVAQEISSGAAALRDLSVKGEQAITDYGNATQQAAEKTASANAKYADALRDVSSAARQATGDARRNFEKATKKATEKFNETLIDDVEKGLDSFLKIQKDYNKELKQDELDTQRTLRDIRQGAADDTQDALDDRNVLELLEIEKTRKRAIRDEEIANKDEADDRGAAITDRLREESDAQDELKRDRYEAREDQKQEMKESFDEQLDDLERSASRRRSQIRKSKAKELAIIEKGLKEQQKAWEEFIKAFLKAGGNLNKLLADAKDGGQSSDTSYAASAFLALNR